MFASLLCHSWPDLGGHLRIAAMQYLHCCISEADRGVSECSSWGVLHEICKRGRGRAQGEGEAVGDRIAEGSREKQFEMKMVLLERVVASAASVFLMPCCMRQFFDGVSIVREAVFLGITNTSVRRHIEAPASSAVYAYNKFAHSYTVIFT